MMKNEYIHIMANLHAIMIQLKEMQERMIELIAMDSPVSKDRIKEIVDELNKAKGV